MTIRSAWIWRSIASLFDTRRPLASTEMNVTSAIPIISAAAVAAVRPGLRRAFSRPMRLIRRDGSTPGNSIGHSGFHFVTALRTHIGSTISRSSGLSKAPSRKLQRVGARRRGRTRRTRSSQ